MILAWLASFTGTFAEAHSNARAAGLLEEPSDFAGPGSEAGSSQMQYVSAARKGESVRSSVQADVHEHMVIHVVKS